MQHLGNVFMFLSEKTGWLRHALIDAQGCRINPATG